MVSTAIHGRLGVFAGVRCRTDSLRIRISGHRRTAADASPVTGVKGSRVQISPARLCKWQSQTGKFLCLIDPWFHDQFSVVTTSFVTTFEDGLWDSHSSYSPAPAGRSSVPVWSSRTWS